MDESISNVSEIYGSSFADTTLECSFISSPNESFNQNDQINKEAELLKKENYDLKNILIENK